MHIFLYSRTQRDTSITVLEPSFEKQNKCTRSEPACISSVIHTKLYIISKPWVRCCEYTSRTIWWDKEFSKGGPRQNFVLQLLKGQMCRDTCPYQLLKSHHYLTCSAGKLNSCHIPFSPSGLLDFPVFNKNSSFYFYSFSPSSYMFCFSHLLHNITANMFLKTVSNFDLSHESCLRSHYVERARVSTADVLGWRIDVCNHSDS